MGTPVGPSVEGLPPLVFLKESLVLWVFGETGDEGEVGGGGLGCGGEVVM